MSGPALTAMFQSTPPVSGRRCARSMSGQSAATWFQSTPPVSGRRCAEGDLQNLLAHVAVSIHAPRFREAMHASRPGERLPRPVSIHAPRFREAMQNLSMFFKAHCQSFNPRPPFPGGDAAKLASVPILIRVSIHAPRFREAMPSSYVRKLASQCFNPRPPFPGGDAVRMMRCADSLPSFQSTPPVSGRRCAGCG